jgi:hypothetical protein
VKLDNDKIRSRSLGRKSFTKRTPTDGLTLALVNVQLDNEFADKLAAFRSQLDAGSHLTEQTRLRPRRVRDCDGNQKNKNLHSCPIYQSLASDNKRAR